MTPVPGSCFDKTIRSALLRSAMRCQPPADGWQRIMGQIAGGCVGVKQDRTLPNGAFVASSRRREIEYGCLQSRLL